MRDSSKDSACLNHAGRNEWEKSTKFKLFKTHSSLNRPASTVMQLQNMLHFEYSKVETSFQQSVSEYYVMSVVALQGPVLLSLG